MVASRHAHGGSLAGCNVSLNCFWYLIGQPATSKQPPCIVRTARLFKAKVAALAAEGAKVKRQVEIILLVSLCVP